MILKISNRVAQSIVAISFIFAFSQSFALTVQPRIDTCYGVGKNDKMSFKSSCKMRGGGGTGIYWELYHIKGRDYYIEYDAETGESMNGRPVYIYGRSRNFTRLPSDLDQNSYSYQCYKSSQAHFCVK